MVERTDSNGNIITEALGLVAGIGIVNGYMKLSEEDKENLKRQLKEHTRFSELLKFYK